MVHEAWQVACKEGILQICEDGLAFYAAIRSNRGLRSDELACLATVERQHKIATDELRAARGEFLRRANDLGLLEETDRESSRNWGEPDVWQ